MGYFNTLFEACLPLVQALNTPCFKKKLHEPLPSLGPGGLRVQESQFRQGPAFQAAPLQAFSESQFRQDPVLEAEPLQA